MNGERKGTDAVDRLYRQRGWLVMLANSYLQDTAAAEDIVNDSFISLIENIGGLGDSVLKAYLAATVKNKCLNYLKRRESEHAAHENIRRRASDAENISILESDRMDFRMFSNEVGSICRDNLARMPKLTSDIFMDRLNGKTYREIAEKYGISQRSVTYEISKVLAVLKEELKDYLPMFLIIVSLMSGKIS